MAIDKSKDAAGQPPPLRVSRVFHARRETGFKAWSSADHVKRWFSPETYSVSDARVEMHAGGPFEVCMRSPAGEGPRSGHPDRSACSRAGTRCREYRAYGWRLAEPA